MTFCGAWLAVNGEAIYDTTYWANGAADGDLRFTIQPDEAFYLHSLTPPGSTVGRGHDDECADQHGRGERGHRGQHPAARKTAMRKDTPQENGHAPFTPLG